MAFFLCCEPNVPQIHARGVVHGDVKSENVLLTSWEWLFLADFATGLKPVALPADNPVGAGCGL